MLRVHAVEVGHEFCVGCDRILVEHERQACEDRIGEVGRGCVQRGRDLVSGILTCWADLHGEQRLWPRTALLGVGGSGDMPRRLNRLEQAASERWWLLERVGPLPRLEWQLLEAARVGKEHLADNLPADPPAIGYELGRWEDDWRHVRGDAPAMAVGNRALRQAARYLEVNMRWAGRNHPAFEEFLSEMADLHGRCQSAVGRAPVQPMELDAQCLQEGCSGQLQHPLVEVTEEQDGQAWQGVAIDMDKHQCQVCGTCYDEQRFALAQAETARRRAQVVVEGEVFGQVTRVAHELGRSRQTLYAWVNQGLARSFEEKGLVFVHVDDATTLHLERPVRAPRKVAS